TPAHLPLPRYRVSRPASFRAHPFSSPSGDRAAVSASHRAGILVRSSSRSLVALLLLQPDLSDLPATTATHAAVHLAQDVHVRAQLSARTEDWPEAGRLRSPVEEARNDRYACLAGDPVEAGFPVCALRARAFWR